MRLLGLSVAIFGLLVLSPTAAAQRSNAPPGNSGVEQYLEVIPRAQGDQSSKSPGRRSDALSPEQRRRLEARGAEGRRLARLVERTAPATDRGASSRETTPRGSGAGEQGADGGPNADGRARRDATLRVPARGQRNEELAPRGIAGGQGGTLTSERGDTPGSAIARAIFGTRGSLGLAVPLLMLAGVAAIAVLTIVRRRGAEPKA